MLTFVSFISFSLVSFDCSFARACDKWMTVVLACFVEGGFTNKIYNIDRNIRTLLLLLLLFYFVAAAAAAAIAAVFYSFTVSRNWYSRGELFWWGGGGSVDIDDDEGDGP